MIDRIRQQYPEYNDMSDEDLTAALNRKFGPDHDNLSGPGVVTAETSHELQKVAPDLKPVVKGTKAEVLRMKMSGQISPQSVVFTDGKDTAYIIHAPTVQGIYGGSLVQAVNEAKRDLKKGGEMESVLLGYPSREGVETPITAAVDKEGNVVTDLQEMQEKAADGEILWAAEGEQGDVEKMASTIGERWKSQEGEDENGEGSEDTENADEGNAESNAEGNADEGRQEGLLNDPQPRETEVNALLPAVAISGETFTGEPGQSHKEVMKANGLKGGHRGFVNDGKFMDRGQAQSWLKRHDPETYKKWKLANPGESLHTQPYAKAKGLK